ncbi:hypothetical protein Tco_1214907 [Tanacetum coccineum]
MQEDRRALAVMSYGQCIWFCDIWHVLVITGKSLCGSAIFMIYQTLEFHNILLTVLKPMVFQEIMSCNDSARYTILLFTLRHDLGVFHLRILTRRLPDSCWRQAQFFQSMYCSMELERIMLPVYIPEPELSEDLASWG